MSIVALAIVLALTVLLQQWLQRHIQGLGLALTGNSGCAIRLLFYLLLPGVLLHEASHYLAAKLLLVRTHGITIGIENANRRQISLGAVNIERSDPVRRSLIGAAPFLVGILAIWLIAGYGFGVWPNSGLTLEQMALRVVEYAHDWTTWLDLYLVFSVSTAMVPSESDREPWGPVIVFFGVGATVLYFSGWVPSVPEDMVVLARQLVDGLTLALGIVVSVNAAIALVLWMLERTVEQVSGKRVEYRVKKR